MRWPASVAGCIVANQPASCECVSAKRTNCINFEQSTFQLHLQFSSFTFLRRKNRDFFSLYPQHSHTLFNLQHNFFNFFFIHVTALGSLALQSGEIKAKKMWETVGARKQRDRHFCHAGILQEYWFSVWNLCWLTAHMKQLCGSDIIYIIRIDSRRTVCDKPIYIDINITSATSERHSLLISSTFRIFAQRDNFAEAQKNECETKSHYIFLMYARFSVIRMRYINGLWWIKWREKKKRAFQAESKRVAIVTKKYPKAAACD